MSTLLARAKLAKDRHDREVLDKESSEATAFFGESPGQCAFNPRWYLYKSGGFYAVKHRGGPNDVWGWRIVRICGECGKHAEAVSVGPFIAEFWELYDLIKKEYLCSLCTRKTIATNL